MVCVDSECTEWDFDLIIKGDCTLWGEDGTESFVVTFVAAELVESPTIGD